MLKNIFPRLLVCAFFSLVWLRYILGETIFLFFLPVVGVALLLVCSKKLFSEKIIAVMSFSWFFAFFFVSLLSSLRSDFYSVYFVFLGFSGFLVAFVLFVDKSFSYFLSSFMFYLFFLLVVMAVIKDPRPAYDSLNNVFPDASRNIVGAIAVFLLSFNMISNYRVSNSVSLLPLLCSFVLVVLAYGRSSIIALAILFLAYFFFYFRRYAFSVFILFFILTITVPFLGLDYERYFLAFTQSGMESPRTQMYAEYWDSLDLPGFLFGESVFNSPVIASFDGNSHSSYIRSHSYYGLLTLVFIGFCFFLVFIRGSVNILVFGVLIAYLFRVSFEQIAFFDVFDFLFFYCILVLSCESGESRLLSGEGGVKNT